MSSPLEATVPSEVQSLIASHLQEKDLNSVVNSSKSLNASGFKTEAETRKEKLEIALEAIQHGTPRERFDALCAHIQKKENKDATFKGIPVYDPHSLEPKPQVHWYDDPRSFSPFIRGNLWAKSFTNGLDVSFKDVFTLINSVDTASRIISVDLLPNYYIEYEFARTRYNFYTFQIHFYDNNRRLKLTFKKWDCNSDYNTTEYEFYYGVTVHKNVTEEALQTLKTQLSATQHFKSNINALAAFSDVSEPKGLSKNEDLYLLQMLLVDTVYKENYPFSRKMNSPFMRGWRKEEPPTPIYFRASFADQCL